MTLGFWSPTNNYTCFGVGCGTPTITTSDSKAINSKQPHHFLSRASIEEKSTISKSAAPNPTTRPFFARERALQYHDLRTGKYQPIIMEKEKRTLQRPAFWAPDGLGCRSRQNLKPSDKIFMRSNAAATTRQDTRCVPEFLHLHTLEGIQPKLWLSTVLGGRCGAMTAREKGLDYNLSRSRKRCFSR